MTPYAEDDGKGGRRLNAAGQALVASLIGKAHASAHRFGRKWPGVPRGELKDQAEEMLIRAVLAYDPEGYGTKLTTLLWPTLWRGLLNWVQNYTRRVEPFHTGFTLWTRDAGAASPLDELKSREPDPSELVRLAEVAEAVEALRPVVHPRDWQVLTGLFSEDRQVVQVAADLGLSDTRVAQIRDAALTRLRRWLRARGRVAV